jgi:hypothetical protein
MHQIGFDFPLHKWLDFKVPKTSVEPNYIKSVLDNPVYSSQKLSAKIIFIGNIPTCNIITKSKKGNSWKIAQLIFETKTETIEISIDEAQANWLLAMLSKLSVDNIKIYSLREVKDDYEQNGLEDFELFWDNKPMNTLWKVGLLCV